MARYRREYSCGGVFPGIMHQIDSYLKSRGYVYKMYEGEELYHKGNGWLSNPKCIKVFQYNDKIVIEGFMKWSILPYISVGEMDFSDNSFLGAIPKAAMKKEVAMIERIILQNSVSFNKIY